MEPPPRIWDAPPSSSLLTCPGDQQSCRRSHSHLTIVRNSRSRCHVHLRETLPRSCPRDPPSRPLPPRRRAHLMGPPPRACPWDPMSQPLQPCRRARLRGHRHALASGIRRSEHVPWIRRRALAP
jgi:hypothetical protein